MKTVLRREVKYGLKEKEARFYAGKFQEIMGQDAHSQGGTYRVRSLYFDTIDDQDFFDKMGEQYLRRKIRLRIYDPAAKWAKLEIKQKQGVFQKKRSIRLSRADAQALVAGNTSLLLDQDSDLAREIYALMTMRVYKPKTIVEYKRRAFVAKENDIRLTFDSDIRATEASMELFSPNLCLYPLLANQEVIFEVKYNRFMLSYIGDIIASIDRTSLSSSKYCLGRQQGYPLYL